MSRVAEASTAPGWVVCPGCRGVLYLRRLARNLGVCPDCDRHHPVPAPERVESLLDAGSVRPLELPVTHADPLAFVDSVPYPQRLAAARRRTGLDEAVVCARGTVHGQPVVVAVMDFRFLGGSLGGAVGELITAAAEVALRERTPLLIVSASGGARMQEGAVSLMQMAKSSAALAALDEAGILTLSLITDPTYGGVAASFATLADVIIAEPGARLGFAGPRVLDQTLGQQLPPGFQTAEFLLDHGLVDVIVARPNLRVTLARLLAVGRAALAGGGATGAGGDPPEVLLTDPTRLPDRDPWDAVRAARDITRPTTVDYLDRLAGDYVELRGDRMSGDCPAVVTALGWLDDTPVAFVGHQKGHSLAELTARGFGMPSPAGYRKAARMMRLAAKLGIPVVTLIDTPGAAPGVEAERQGQSVAIAENLRLMSGLPVPVVAVVTGEGGSGGALALGVANRVLMFANAVYSVITPEGCAAILWKDPAAAPTAARALRVDAGHLLRLGVVDAVVPEPEGGAGRDHAAAAATLRAALGAALAPLAGLDGGELVRQRRDRFRRFGAGPAGPPHPATFPDTRPSARHDPSVEVVR